MASVSPLAIGGFDPSETFSLDDLPTMAEYQAQQQAQEQADIIKESTTK